MGVFTPFSKEELIPQEEMIYIEKASQKLFIGIPKENFKYEQRVCLSPEAVGMLVANGHEVLIESEAGIHASYTDFEYSEAGATIVKDTKKIFECPIVIKVAPPTLEEIKLMSSNAFLFSAIQLKTQTKEYFQELIKKKITAVSYELVKDQSGICPFLYGISEIAGIASIHIASEYMSKTNSGKGVLFGNITGIAPTEIVIIGAGTVAENAARTALAMGANVKIFDNNIHKLKKIQNVLPHPVFTSTIQEKVLKKALMRCDVVIGAIKGKNRTPIIATQLMTEKMKKGAIIIDVCIDNGGCFEISELTTHEQPIVEKNNVFYYGVPNIASRYPKTSSLVISNTLSSYLLDLSKNGSIEDAIHFDTSLKNGVYMYKGILVKEYIGKWYNLEYRDIHLLMC